MERRCEELREAGYHPFSMNEHFELRCVSFVDAFCELWEQAQQQNVRPSPPVPAASRSS